MTIDQKVVTLFRACVYHSHEQAGVIDIERKNKRALKRLFGKNYEQEFTEGLSSFIDLQVLVQSEFFSSLAMETLENTEMSELFEKLGRLFYDDFVNSLTGRKFIENGD